MADKEERILITKVSPHCHAQRICCDPFDDEDGMFCDKSGRYVRITDKDCTKCKNPVIIGISRADAVERMAKAMFDYCTDGTEPQNWELKEVRDSFNKEAEAALDALLVGNK